RKALRLLERLTAARRAAGPVRALRRGTVVRRHNLLGGERHLVDRTPAEVDHLLGMSWREGRGIAGVAGVGRTGRISARHRGGQRRISDRAVERAVADRLILAVPTGGREP